MQKILRVQITATYYKSLPYHKLPIFHHQSKQHLLTPVFFSKVLLLLKQSRLKPSIPFGSRSTAAAKAHTLGVKGNELKFRTKNRLDPHLLVSRNPQKHLGSWSLFQLFSMFFLWWWCRSFSFNSIKAFSIYRSRPIRKKWDLLQRLIIFRDGILTISIYDIRYIVPL